MIHIPPDVPERLISETTGRITMLGIFRRQSGPAADSAQESRDTCPFLTWIKSTQPEWSWHKSFTADFVKRGGIGLCIQHFGLMLEATNHNNQQAEEIAAQFRMDAGIVLQPILLPLQHKHFCTSLVQLSFDMRDDPRVHAVFDADGLEWLKDDNNIGGSDLELVQEKLAERFGRHRVLTRAEALDWLETCWRSGKIGEFQPAA